MGGVRHAQLPIDAEGECVVMFEGSLDLKDEAEVLREGVGTGERVVRAEDDGDSVAVQLRGSVHAVQRG